MSNYQPEEDDWLDDFIGEMICDGCGYAVSPEELCEDCSLCITCCHCLDFLLEEDEDLYDE